MGKQNGQQQKKYCPEGHPYSGDNLILRYGWRYCRECKNRRQREYVGAREAAKRWMAVDKDRAAGARAIKFAKRRALESQAEGSFSRQEWENILIEFDFKCAGCREVKKLTVDHIIPLSKGGSNWITNIQPLCSTCNSKKGNKLNFVFNNG